MSHIHRSLVVAAFCLISAFFPVLSSHAQSKPWDGEPFSGEPKAILEAATSIAPDRYPYATVLLDEARFTIDEAKRITRTRRLIFRVDSPKAVQGWGRTSTYWEPWHQERPEIKARVITPDGKVLWLDEKTLTDSPQRQQSENVYTDTRYYGGPLPGIAVGVIVEEVSVRKDKEPFFEAGTVQRYGFSAGYPIAFTRVVIDHPSSLKLQTKLHNLPNVVQRTAENGGRTQLIIEQGRTEAQPPVPELIPPDTGMRGLLQFTTAASWKSVNETYLRQIANGFRQADVAELVKQTVKPKEPRQTKIAKLLARLHKEVRYTGIEFGEASIIPRPPSDTLARQFGDCKDKSVLLVTMLREAGIPAHLALVRTGSLDIDPEVPGFGLFDHAIVYVPGSVPLWIDATAEFNVLGNVPSGIRDRLALVIDGVSAQPVRIPGSHSKDNRLVETREFFLAGYGPAKVVEVSEADGFIDAGYRSFFSGPTSKSSKEDLESYGKSVYLAESIADSRISDGHDLLSPFKIQVEFKKARRGFTELNQAVAAVRIDGLFSRMPKFFTTEEKPKKDNTEPDPPRTVDYYFQPFQIEWRYQVHPPLGFRLHALPAPVDRSLGPGRLTQTWKSGPDGLVEGIVLYDTGKGRYTVGEAQAARDAILQALKEPATLIRFENTGAALIAQGKIREGLTEYERAISAEPKQPLHRIRLSRALLQAGLGEQARKEADAAVKLDETSVLAHSNLAWALEHDLFGRRFGRGLDRDGAVAAYKRAIEIDPKDTDPRASMGIILEFDKDGDRYTSGARLDEAIAAYESLKALDKDTYDRFEINLVYCLLYSEKFSRLVEQIGSRAGEERFREIAIAASAASDGSQAALLQSSRLSSSQQERTTMLRDASRLLLRLRRYKEASELLAVAAQGAEDAANLQAQVEMFRRTKRFEQAALGADNPASAVHNLFASLVTHAPTNDVIRHFSSSWKSSGTQKIREARIRYMRSLVSTALGDTGLPKATTLDLILSNTEFSHEGDESTGYRVWCRLPDAEPQPVFVVREDGEYRVLSFLYLDPLGWEALGRMKANKVAEAAKLLDWARQQTERSDADDEIGGDLFARLWEKGMASRASAAAVETAALALVIELTEQDLTSNVERVSRDLPDTKRAEADRLLWQAYAAVKRWNDVQPVGARLLQAHPRSQTAFLMHSTGLLALRRYDELERVARERLTSDPDDEAARSILMQALAAQDRLAEEREILRGKIKAGRARADELNNYAWHALFTTVDDESLEIARRSAAATNQNNYGVLHTLACLYAEVGKTAEARDLMFKAMDAARLDELDSALWFVYGRIAEQYGQNDAARTAYAKVEKDEPPSVDQTSTYTLAARRLAAMDAAAKNAAKASEQKSKAAK